VSDDIGDEGGIRLRRESDDGEFVHQTWEVDEGLSVCFIANLTRPCVFVNYKDRDIIHALRDLGFLGVLEEEQLRVETPHGVGHNCFKVPSAGVMRFLVLLRAFCRASAPALDAALCTDPRLKDWRESWWEQVG
jgi:hypothetical protein